MRFKSTGEMVGYHILLWVLCVMLAFMGFYLKYHEIIDVQQSFLITHLSFLLSFPKSFGDTLHISTLDSSRLLLPLFFWFWGGMSVLYYLMLKWRSKLIFILIAAIAGVAAYNWLVVSWSMMGI